MIDPHVHLRDWGQSDKETVRHGLSVAYRAGLDALFEMPNTEPPLTGRKTIDRRLALADQVLGDLDGPMFHGLYAGVTADKDQLAEVVEAWRDLFPRVVGLKMYAGHSTGRMGLVTEAEQSRVYRALSELGYTGVLAVHAEKESLLLTKSNGEPDWDPDSPETHADARPPAAEVASVEDQLTFAAEARFQGTLHIVHISTLRSLASVEQARRDGTIAVRCGLTPHHGLLTREMMRGPEGLLAKMNPPLRQAYDQQGLLAGLLDGRIDWIETDHAPHTVADKIQRYASGIPVLPFYPRFVQRLTSARCPSARCRAGHPRRCSAYGSAP